jgi:predicted HD phosphohydrolase
MSHFQADFQQMRDGTASDWQQIIAAEQAHHRRQPGGPLLQLLSSFQHADPLCFPINVYQHSLQTATRALRSNASDEMVFVALFHDIADLLVERNHGEVAASILKPYISEASVWLLIHHAQFQMAFYADKVGMNAKAYEQYCQHPHFETTWRFCEDWDQASFSKSYDNLPLEHFIPLVERVVSRVK